MEYLFDDYEEVGGPILLRPARGGVPQPRFGQPPPCDRCPKIPRGAPPVPSSALGWTEPRHRLAWEHYRFCRIGHAFPQDDPLVRRHALLFDDVEVRIERSRQERQQRLLTLLVTARATGGG